LAQVADDALQQLKSLSQVQLSRWCGDSEGILTNKTNVTLHLVLDFAIEKEPPHRPVNVLEGDRLRVGLRTQFKLSGAGRKVPSLRAWWNQRVEAKVFEIPDVGEHHLKETGWFVRSVETVLPPDELADAMTKVGLSVLNELSRRLGDVGLSLSIVDQETAG
jgi:hypothetical protein